MKNSIIAALLVAVMALAAENAALRRDVATWREKAYQPDPKNGLCGRFVVCG